MTPLFAIVQILDRLAAYRAAMRSPSARQAVRPTDFTLKVHASPGATYEWSKVLLARAKRSGTLELLTAAWEQILGYGRHELDGKTLSDLMWSSKAAAAGAVAAILDELDMSPVELTLRCRSGEARSFRLHRRFDGYARRMFIVADEIARVQGRAPGEVEEASSGAAPVISRSWIRRPR
jgi:PAS domain-containing protein